MIIAVIFFSNISLKKKIGASTGFEPVTSALPLRCSTNWAMKRHIGSEVNLLSSYLPWGVKWCEVYEIIHFFWTAVVDESCRWEWRSLLLSNCVYWKKFTAIIILHSYFETVGPNCSMFSLKYFWRRNLSPKEFFWSPKRPQKQSKQRIKFVARWPHCGRTSDTFVCSILSLL